MNTNASPAPTDDRRAELGLLLMAAIWAVNFSVVKLALDPVSPLAFNALRFILAAIALYAILRRRGPIPRPRREDVLRIVVLGIVGNVLYQLLFIFGLDLTRAGNASLLLAATPVWTAILSAGFGHEKLSGGVWLGVLATLVGMALVVLGGGGGVGMSAATFRGDVLMMAASVGWAIYTVAARGPIARYGTMAVTGWTLWVGTALLVLLGIPDLVAQDWSLVSPGVVAAVVYSGVLSIAVAYLFWYRGVRVLGSTRTATFSNVVPVLALVVAWIWLGEVPTLLQVAGAAVIIGGVRLTRRAR